MRDAAALTDRETLVVLMRQEGWTRKEIAGEIGVSVAAVDKVMGRVRGKIFPDMVKKRELSLTEALMLQALADGASPAKIAREFEITLNTVRDHLKGARAKLGAKHTTHAVALAWRQGSIR